MQYDLLCRSKSYTILNQKLIELNVNSLDFWLGSGNTVKRQFECSCNWHVSCISTCSHTHSHAHSRWHAHAHVGVSDAKLIKCIITTICNLLRSHDNADTKRQRERERERERSKESGSGSGSRKVVLLLLQLQVLPTTMTSIVCDAVCVCVCVWESETEKRAGASAWRERECESARNWTCEIIERRHENKA